ncbi:MAG: NAD(P)-binding domain-containing protein [Candidatus Zixiibacteriota bacterium]
MIIETAIYTLIGLAALLIARSYWKRSRRLSMESSEKFEKAFSSGLTEPVSLHPKVDPVRCICVGACLTACPEGGILGIVDGHAELVSPTKCIGHGICMQACPVDAISLVFGTERRGVDIPNVSETFETNVPGIYIAGELGGMGLIRNAVTQGREAVEHIAQAREEKPDGVHDLVIVGAGPAGRAATLQAKKSGLDAVTIDQDDLGGAALSYPRQKLVMTQPMEIPLYGKSKFREISKEELLELWEKIVKDTGITVNTHEKVEEVSKKNGHFVVRTSKESYETKRVLLAIGRRGTPRKLGVTGENGSSKVAYKLLEPEQYRGKAVLVVGGGNSSAEAALALCEQEGAHVTSSIRGEVFAQANEENREKLRQAEESGKLTVLCNSNVREIRPETVVIDCDGEDTEIPNDYVFVFIGGELPTKFLEKMGIQVEQKFGER